MSNPLLAAEVATTITNGQKMLADTALKLGWYRQYGVTTLKSYRLRLLYLFLVALETWTTDPTTVNYLSEQQLQELLSKTQQLLQCGCSCD